MKNDLFKALVLDNGSSAAFSDSLYLIVNNSLAIIKRDKDWPYYKDVTFGISETLGSRTAM